MIEWNKLCFFLTLKLTSRFLLQAAKCLWSDSKSDVNPIWCHLLEAYVKLFLHKEGGWCAPGGEFRGENDQPIEI